MTRGSPHPPIEGRKTMPVPQSDAEPPLPSEPAVEFDDTGRDTGIEQELTGESRGFPFDPNQIEVHSRPTNVALLLSRLRQGQLNLTPDFQRRSGIWKGRQQSRLVESLLLRIALPTLYAAEEKDSSWSVVDGVQRLTAIFRFVAPELLRSEPLRLQDLEYLTELNGASFSDLTGRLQTRILESELTVLLIRLGTPEAAKMNIFARINTNGLPLSRQELRHALIPGKARELIAELATSEEFREATGQGISPDRMSDREMCLRFLAFTVTPAETYDEQDFDEFLRTTMHHLNRLPDAALDDLRDAFRRGMAAGRSVFGPHAFRKQLPGSGRQKYPVNKALFESQSVLLSQLSDAEISELSSRSADVNSRLQQLLNRDPEYFDSVSSGTGDPGKVHHRFQALKELFREVLND